MIINNKDIV